MGFSEATRGAEASSAGLATCRKPTFPIPLFATFLLVEKLLLLHLVTSAELARLSRFLRWRCLACSGQTHMENFIIMARVVSATG